MACHFDNLYIPPITKIYSSFAEAKEFFDKLGGVTYFETAKRLKARDLAQGKRNLVIGEPGVGKTLLLGKIKNHLEDQGIATSVVNLRQPNAINQIEDSIKSAADMPRALLLDGLDEIQSSLFPAVLRKIEEVADHYDGPIFISARWVFIARHSTSFPQFRFIVVSPFTSSQVKEYLIATGLSEADTNALFHVLSFSHRMLVIQIPRYLHYFAEFWKRNGLTDAMQVSRNELFEHFIYSKLELEDTKLSSDKRAITKRVLEKLALAMEIYQTNVISKDDLMTFFDELKSDLKLAALSQLAMEAFFEYSLLKNNGDTIEFENTEFQEYLAAKEITRFAAPGRAAFAFAADSDVHEIYPTWFNALTFLIDMEPDLFEQIIEFSGLHSRDFKIIDEGFFTFFGRIDPRNISAPLKRALFSDLIEYHSRTRQWLSAQLSAILSSFFDSSLEARLKLWVDAALDKHDPERYVSLANVAHVVNVLLQDHKPLDRSYWRKNLIAWVSDANENVVLRRQALSGLEALGDAGVINELPDLMGSEELLERAFISLCATLDPDNPKSFEHLVDAVRRDNVHAYQGLVSIKQPESIKKLFQLLINDATFRREFLEQSSYFKDPDISLANVIRSVNDDELIGLCKDALIAATHYDTAHRAEKSAFIRGLWRALKDRSQTDFILEMVHRLEKSPNGRSGFFFSRTLFADVIDQADVLPYLDLMITLKEEHSAFAVLLEVKASGREGANEIFEAGRTRLPQLYEHWENERSKPVVTLEMQADNRLHEFRALLRPEPGFSTNVFAFYNRHASEPGPRLSAEDRARIVDLLTNTIFKINPLEHELTITEEQGGSRTYRMSSTVHIFGEALTTARDIGFDVRPFRQQILNYILFAYTGELRAIFELFTNIQQSEMTGILKIYKERTSDLWRHQPGSLTDAAEQYHVTAAAPILRDFVTEPQFDSHVRQRALVVGDSLAPDLDFLKKIFTDYKSSSEASESALALVANGLLITAHLNREAVEWRLAQIVDRAVGFIQPSGAHSVGPIEEELTFSGTFARPLMELKSPDYLEDYLRLLDSAMPVWKKGSEFQAYAAYMWKIVYAYLDNLKEGRSYLPLKKVEDKIARMQDQEGANWLAAQMAALRRSYLSYLGKPRTISEAIKKQNEAREFDDKKILNSADLFRHLQDALETDLRRWIEGEGAYDVINFADTKAIRQQHEKLIQKTLKTQLENILLRRGFQIEVVREPQLLNEKRPDFLVRYGFAGPIVIEVKLTSNADLIGSKIEESASYKSMRTYMQGFGSLHGIFLIVKNTDANNLPVVKTAFEKIPNVWVSVFDGFANRSAPRNRFARVNVGRHEGRSDQNELQLYIDLGKEIAGAAHERDLCDAPPKIITNPGTSWGGQTYC
jgi:hypothetical protein